MRPRTFILLILVLVVGAVATVLVVSQLGGVDLFGGTDVVDVPAELPGESDLEPGEPAPTATPSVRLDTVVVALVDLPLGERIRHDLIRLEQRPSDNIALQGGYTFPDPEEVVGRITKIPISKGQAILRPMVALNPTDLASSGSDLALYVDQGKVAVAFPIDKFTGIAYALRPGDLVDAMMTLRIMQVDPEFNTALPNVARRVDESSLLAGTSFLFPESTQGRLEFLPEIGQTVEFVPGVDPEGSGEDDSFTPIPKRVTQLTIQQAEVLWVGTWRDPREFEKAAEAEAALAVAEAEAQGIVVEGGGEEEGVPAEPTPEPERFENRPDVIILSMLTQDALTLKWALERGVDIDLALRAQGDTTVFVTNSVSLPQIIDQGSLILPEESEIDLAPRADEVERPSLPPNPPRN